MNTAVPDAFSTYFQLGMQQIRKVFQLSLYIKFTQINKFRHKSLQIILKWTLACLHSYSRMALIAETSSDKKEVVAHVTCLPYFSATKCEKSPVIRISCAVKSFGPTRTEMDPLS